MYKPFRAKSGYLKPRVTALFMLIKEYKMQTIEKLTSFQELPDQELETVSGGGRYYQAWISSCTNQGYIVAVQSKSNPRQIGYTQALSPAFAQYYVNYVNKYY
jgi:COMC family